MSVELVNMNQLRSKIDGALKEYVKLPKEEIPIEALTSIINTLIFERNLLIREIDELKENQEQWLPIIYRKLGEFNLVINDLKDTVFNDFTSFAQKLGLTPGELLSFLMKKVVTKLHHSKKGRNSVQFKEELFPQLSTEDLEEIWKSRDKYEIYDLENLSITKEDLIEADSQISFSNIRLLEFIDIDQKLFMTYVDKIKNCGLVRVPKSISKLLLYAKCSYCDQFEFYGQFENFNSSLTPF
ncbi:MAG: hypothetical protein ACFFCZ_12575 [Promethearchaeota archaeon]